MKRILHRSLDTKNWHEARKTAEQWLEWGQPSEPLPDSELLNRLDVTIDQAVRFWFSFSAETHTKGGSTKEKYEVLLNRRLKTWAVEKRKQFIRDFDDPILVKQFFMSWRNLQPTRNKKQVTNLEKPLAVTTKRAELERLRTFLDFCKQNGWVKINYAKPPFIKLGAIRIAQNFAWTMDEYQNIIRTLEKWTDRYYKTNPRADRLRAFAYTLRFSGQRISDVAMLGPENIIDEAGNYFLGLTQIKTGMFVKIPIPAELVVRLRALPVLGKAAEPLVLQRSNYSVTYGTQFWFWTADGCSEVARIGAAGVPVKALETG
jgi:integrase